MLFGDQFQKEEATVSSNLCFSLQHFRKSRGGIPAPGQAGRCIPIARGDPLKKTVS